MATLCLRCCVGSCVVVKSRGYSLVLVHGLVSLRSTDSRHKGSFIVFPELYSTGSVVVTQGLSRSEECGIFLDQGSNLCLLHWPGGGEVLSSPTEPSGKPLKLIQCYMSTICQQKAKETNKQKQLKKIPLNSQPSLVTVLCFFSKKSIFKKLCPLTLSTPTHNHSVACLGLPASPWCHKTHACRDHQEPPCSTSRRHFQSSCVGLSMASDATA